MDISSKLYLLLGFCFFCGNIVFFSWFWKKLWQEPRWKVNVTVTKYSIEKVEACKCLCLTVCSGGECGNWGEEAEQASGWRKVRGVMCNERVSALVSEVWKVVVRPVMLSGSETAALLWRFNSGPFCVKFQWSRMAGASSQCPQTCDWLSAFLCGPAMWVKLCIRPMTAGLPLILSAKEKEIEKWLDGGKLAQGCFQFAKI